MARRIKKEPTKQSDGNLTPKGPGYRPSSTEIVRKWLPKDGDSLEEHPFENWVCLHVYPQAEFTLAHRCASTHIPFFLPLLDEPGKDYLVPLWPSYIFCRGSREKINKLIQKGRVHRVLVPEDERRLLVHLRKFSRFSTLAYFYDKGDVVRVISGALGGVKAKVSEPSKPNGTVKLAIEVLGKTVNFEWKIANLETVYRRKARPGVIPSDYEPEFLKDESPEQALNIELSAINDELIKYFARHPEYLYKISPRRFEELIAEILADMGYDVELTPPVKDGGRDILAVFRIPHGEILTIVECKRYRPHRKIGVDIVERFLYVMDRQDIASCGLIATTSYFSSDARLREQQYRWKLKLQDFDGLQEWLQKYGTWMRTDESGMWLPSGLMVPLEVRQRIYKDVKQLVTEDGRDV